MRTRVLLAGGLMLVLLAASFTAAAGARTKGETATKAATRIDLATYNAKRWIVQLKGKPLARYPGAKRAISYAGLARPKLDLKAGVNRRYLTRLARTQRGFAVRLRSAVRGVRIERTYRLTLNGMAVRMSKAQAAKVRRMKGVVAVTPDIPYQPSMYATPAQIGAPALWAQLGGQANAGRGVKVAIIDSGVYVTKDAAGNYTGNPCFNDAGYTAPAGYPKGDTRFTNNKVIVARAYFRPPPFAPPTAGNDTPVQGPGGSPHGTHTGGTVGCNANTPVGLGSLTITGIAPAAYLMNYRIFYPSQSPDGFENGNGWVVEIVQAIEDAVADGADVLSNSWGSSHQNTYAWPDPMVQAAESAVDAGVVGVWAQGNGGPATGTGNLPSSSDKVISVGAVTKYATLIESSVNVIGRPDLQNLDTGPASFGPSMVGKHVGPANYVPAQVLNSGANPAEGCGTYPAGSLTGKIALIVRGTCEFGAKVFNAQQAGAIGALIYNSPAGGDALQAMGGGVFGPQVTIPSVFMRRTNGLAMVTHYTANPAAAQAEFFYNPHGGANPGDVMAGFSSRGPTQEKTVKPDVVAPGVDVLSSGYGAGAFPGPFVGFGSASGTSMATPHVAGAAALLLQLHPAWTPAMVKSALMSTATEDVFATTARTTRAGVLDRGAGRIDLAQAGSPGLVFDKPSLSGGEQRGGGQSRSFTVRATNVSGATDTWDITTTETGDAAKTANFNITVGTSVLTLGNGNSGSIRVTTDSVAAAPTGEYEGSVVLVSRATGKRLHIPVWFRVVPAVQKDVLLIDDDGSNTGGLADRKAAYTAMLDSLGLTYDYLDMGLPPFTPQAKPGLMNLFKYRAVVLFTGDNNDFNNLSGFFGEDHDNLAEWLDSGGRIWALGQNLALAEDSGTYHSRLDRGRIYSGYLGLAYEADSVNAAGTTGLGPFAGMALGISQTSVEGSSSPSFDTDTYNSRRTTQRFFQTGAGAAVSHGRTSDPTLEEERQEYLYRAVSMGFGIEGLTGPTTATQLGDRSMDWLLDQLTVGLASSSDGPGKRATMRATAASSVGATITKYRWDFGDGTAYETTTGPTVLHKYQHRGTYEVRIEATDSLGHTNVSHAFVGVKPKD